MSHKSKTFLQQSSASQTPLNRKTANTVSHNQSCFVCWRCCINAMLDP